MNTNSDIDAIFDKIVGCMNELADAKGVSRCALIYALAQLIDALKENVAQMNTALQERIDELEKQLKVLTSDEDKSEEEEA